MTADGAAAQAKEKELAEKNQAAGCHDLALSSDGKKTYG